MSRLDHHFVLVRGQIDGLEQSRQVLGQQVPGPSVRAYCEVSLFQYLEMRFKFLGAKTQLYKS